MNFEYIDKIKELIEMVKEKENKNMEACVELITEAVWNKKSIYIFGASHAGILTQEMFYRAGGLMLINPIFGREVLLDNTPITLTSKMERCIGYGTVLGEKVGFKNNDVFIVHSVSGRNPISIEIAMVAKKSGTKIIGITNLNYSKQVTSRHPCKKNLFEFCDIVLDNHGDIGDACVPIKGLEVKVSPTSTVIGAIMLNSIIAASVQRLVDEGMKIPPVFFSANIDGGDELNKELYEKYKDSIHYKF